MRPRASPPPPARLYVEWLTVALLATFCVVMFVVDDTTARLDNMFYDQALRADARPAPDDIIIVAIDDRSLQQIGRWPWSRAVHAAMLDRLAAAGPRAVGYDVLFTEPTPDDPALAAAMRKSHVYLPLLIDVPGSNGASFDAVLPTSPLTAAAAGIGHVNIGFDGDRVIRHVFLEEGGGDRHWLQLSALMGGVRMDPIAYPRKPGFWQRRAVLVPYSGGAGHIRTISFVDVLRGRVPPEFLRGRFILVGAVADGMGDSYPTPTSGSTSQMAGVEIQAHLLDGLLSGRIISPAPRAMVMLVALAALWILLAGFLWVSPRRSGQVLALLFVVLLVGCYALLRIGHIWLAPTPAVLGLLIVYPLWGWRRLQAISGYMIDELERLNGEQDQFPQARDRIVVRREVTLQATLLQQAIGRLRDLRRFLADAIGNLPDALFVTDMEGHILLTNERAQRLARSLSIDAARGADVRPLLACFRSPDGTSPDVPASSDIVDRGEIEVISDDGSSFDLRFAAQRDAGDRHVGWIVRIVDVSRLKQAERHREEALQFLSHDMRAPQSAILNLLLSDSGAIPAPLAARIGNHARQTLGLAENFVQLARAETKPAEHEELDLCDAVIDAADALWSDAKSRRVSVVTDACDEPQLMFGDRALLTRAVINLIGNAVKYSNAGGKVTCAIHETEDDRLRLLVSDEGVGMTEEQSANLFQRFRQGPREGIGLGLMLVQTVVQRHGGTIGCESAPGAGTTFTIDLPRDRRA